MGDILKVERTSKIHAPASKLHDMWSAKLHLLPSLCPDIVHSIDLIEGNWEQEGYVTIWKFNYQGKPTVATAIAEVIDHENKVLVFKATEDGPLEMYKSFKWILKAGSKRAHWTVEYEKDDDHVDAPEPNGYLELALVFTHFFDTHLMTSP